MDDKVNLGYLYDELVRHIMARRIKRLFMILIIADIILIPVFGVFSYLGLPYELGVSDVLFYCAGYAMLSVILGVYFSATLKIISLGKKIVIFFATVISCFIASCMSFIIFYLFIVFFGIYRG